jgi:hypothetical protein
VYSCFFPVFIAPATITSMITSSNNSNWYQLIILSFSRFSFCSPVEDWFYQLKLFNDPFCCLLSMKFMLKKNRFSTLIWWTKERRDKKKESDVSVRMNVRRHLTSIRW